MDEGRVVASGSVHDVLRPEVLHPVYGEHLAFGSRFVSGWGEERPYVLSWQKPDGGPLE
jgi:ABC-type hemin transport system ATPase subunit